MRSKTRQQLMLKEYEYNENLPDYDDVINEIETRNNFEDYGYNENDKDLREYLDELILKNRENVTDVYNYTKSNIPPKEFTYTKNDIHIYEDGKKSILVDEDNQVIRGNTDEVYGEVFESDDGQLYISAIFKLYIKENYDKSKLLSSGKEKQKEIYLQV